MADLVTLLSQLRDIKASLKSALGTSSDALDEYPTLIENYMIDRYNEGYSDGWLAVTGSTYSGNKKSHVTYTPTIPSWQGSDTSQYETLVNIMASVVSIRQSMKTAARLNTTSNVFARYPELLNTQGLTQYNNGYAAGQADGQGSAPQKTPTPVISINGNNVLITCSDSNGITYWITSSASGAQANSKWVSGMTASYTITSSDSGKYLRAFANKNGMNNSDIATSSQLRYIEPAVPDDPGEPAVEAPDAPSWYRNTTENVIHISSPSGTRIKYSTNGGSSWNTITSNSGTIPIPTSGIAKGNFKAYCYLISDSSVVSQTVENTSALSYYTAPVIPDEPDIPSTQAETPFWIKITNITGTKTLISDDGTDKIQVSTSPVFTTTLTPTVVDSKDNFSISPNTVYYIRAIETAANLDGYAKKIRIDSYTGGMYITAGGNLNSLVYGSGLKDSLNRIKSVPNNAFYKDSTNYFGDISGTTKGVFRQALKDISQMYFPSCGTSAYRNLFYSCVSLDSIPEEMFNDSFKSVGNYGCYDMFRSCTKITTTPKLYATTVGSYAYYEMFDTCSAITTVRDIEATTIGDHSMMYMFYYASAITTGPSELKATALASYCYEYMFKGCSKLKKAPIIRAADITSSNIYAMNRMFEKCSSLNYVEVHFANWLTSNYQTGSWLSDVASSGTFVKGSECTWDTSSHTGSADGIPSGWTVFQEEEDDEEA